MKRTTTLIVAALLVAAVTPVHADGVLIPGHWPAPRPLPAPLPAFAVKYHHVDVVIDGQVARTRIDQVFVNESSRELEATYLFPVPEGAAIDEFDLWVGGEKVAARVLDRDEARRIYESIVRQRKDPALLEYVDRGVISARVYPIPPRGEQRIAIEYAEVLDRDFGLVRYTYPLNTEKYSARPIESVRISLEIRSDVPIKNVYSPTHDPSIRRPDDRTALVTHEESGTRPDVDFTVYYTLSEDDVGLGLLTYRPLGEDGYFLLLASPRAEIQDARIEAKDVVFVFDRTGSMSGEKIEQAREALKFSLRNLGPRDRFNVVAFNESPDPLFTGLVPATRDNIARALELADGLDASGGTNIDDALATALPMVDDDGRPGFVLFLTDGLPTVGVRDPQEILAHARKVAPDHVRLFVFGVGYDVNTLLLDQLAHDHSGAPEYVRPGEDLEVKVSNLYRRISYPVLTDVALDLEGIEPYDVFPRELPDLFKGSQIVVAGRYRGSGRAQVVLTGRAGDEEHRFTLRRVDVDGRRDDFIPGLWANRKIGYLVSELRLKGHDQELVDEIVRLSKKHGIITEYTSFLIEEPDIVFARDFEEKAEGSFRAINAAKLRETSGGSAVNQSINLGSQRKAAKAMAPAAQSYFDAAGEAVTVTQVRNVANRIFFQKGVGWVENTFTEGQDVLAVRSFSEAQFQLLARDPSLGKLMSLGDEVLIMINGRPVRIGTEGVARLTDRQLEELFGA
jgi:Ca-activated chloride channel family protein